MAPCCAAAVGSLLVVPGMLSSTWAEPSACDSTGTRSSPTSLETPRSSSTTAPKPTSRRRATASDGGTKLVLTNFNGWIYIEGSRFKVNARGGMAFVAKGKGWAFLQGEGVWRTRRNHGVWSQGGDRYKIG